MGCDVRLRNHLIGIGHAEADDASGFASLHSRRYCFGKIENRMEIAVEHLVPTLDRFLEQVHSMVGTGAVDQCIDPSPLLFDLGDEANGRLGV